MWIPVLILLAVTATALIDFYTEVDITFEVEKMIVLENEHFNGSKGYYVRPVNFGKIKQGGNAYGDITIKNRDEVTRKVNVSFYRAYKGDRYKSKEETLENDWNITVIIDPDEITIPAGESRNVTVGVEIGDNTDAAGYKILIRVGP